MRGTCAPHSGTSQDVCATIKSSLDVPLLVAAMDVMANERLRDAILAKGFSPDQVATRLGVDSKTVERWITQGRVPYPRHRHSLAAIVQESESYLWPNALDGYRSESAAESEVVKLYPHRNSIPADLWDRLLATVEESVDILVLAGIFFGEIPAAIKNLRQKADQGVQVRLLVGDPSCRAVTVRGDEESLGKGVLAARIRNALASYRPLLGHDRIQIQFHQTNLYSSIFRFDNEMIVNMHVYGCQGAQAPALHLRRLATGDLFETYTSSFAMVWESAKEAVW